MQPQQVTKKRVRLTKLSPREKKLEGKTFYLDNLKKCQTTVVWENIHALGGKVESFLHREVNIVVTGSKEELECQRSGGTKEGALKPEEEVQQTAKQQERSLSNEKLKQQPVTPRPVPCGSRGKALLEKAIRNKERLQESSVLSNARSWGVKIMYVDDALSYLKQLPQESLTGKQKPLDIKARTLKPPFLKIEDLSRKYKPLSMPCVSLPILCYRGHYSPFEPPPPPAFWDKKEPDKEKNKARDNKVESIPSDKFQTPPIFEHLPRLLRKKDGSYCEICRQSFRSMEEHLQSDQHRSFVLDPSNYTMVDQLVAEMLPGFEPNPPDQIEETASRSHFLNVSELELFAEAEEERTVQVLLGQTLSIIIPSASLAKGLLSSSSSPDAQVTTPGLPLFAAEPDFQHAIINVKSPVMPVLHIEPQAQEALSQQPDIELLSLCPSSPHPLPDLYPLPPVLSPQIPFTAELSNPYSDPPVLSPQPVNTDQTVSTFISEFPLPSLVSVVADGVEELYQDGLVGIPWLLCPDSVLKPAMSSPQRTVSASGQSAVLPTSKKRCRSASPEGGNKKRKRRDSLGCSSCPTGPTVTCMKSIKDNIAEAREHAVIQTCQLPNEVSSLNTQSEHTCVLLRTVLSDNSQTFNLNNSSPIIPQLAKVDPDSVSMQCPSTSICIEAALIPATTFMATSSSDSDWDCELLSWLGSSATTLQVPSEQNRKMDEDLLHRPCTWMHDTSYDSHLHTALRPLTSTGSQCVEDKDSLSFPRTSAQIVK